MNKFIISIWVLTLLVLGVFVVINMSEKKVSGSLADFISETKPQENKEKKKTPLPQIEKSIEFTVSKPLETDSQPKAEKVVINETMSGRSPQKNLKVLKPSFVKWKTPWLVGAQSGEPGYPAIARWNVVPKQSFKESIEIGVIAFHHEGIQKVQFSANGGSWVDVDKITRNRRTKTSEYCVLLKVQESKEEKLVIRARVLPIKGQTRNLPELILFHQKGQQKIHHVYVSHRGTDDAEGSFQKPFKTLRKGLKKVQRGGKVILLDGGQYILNEKGVGNKPGEKWITIETARHLRSKDVIIRTKERGLLRPGVNYLKWKGVAFDFHHIDQYYPESGSYVWFDQCLFYNSFGWDAKYSRVMPNVRLSKLLGGSYATKCEAKNILYGLAHFTMVRNCHLENISGDAFTNTEFVVNCTLKNINGSVSSFHSDLFQYFGDFDNTIVYGIRADRVIKTQNFFLDHYKSSFKNMAFVNIGIVNQPGNVPFSQLNSKMEHILFYHVSNPGQTWMLRDDFIGEKKFKPRNVNFVNCVLEEIKLASRKMPLLIPGMNFSYCHFSDGLAYGQQASSGKIGFGFVSPLDYRYFGDSINAITGRGLVMKGVAEPSRKSIDKGAYPFSESLY